MTEPTQTELFSSIATKNKYTNTMPGATNRKGESFINENRPTVARSIRGVNVYGPYPKVRVCVSLSLSLSLILWCVCVCVCVCVTMY